MTTINDLSQINEKISALEAEKVEYIKNIESQKRALEKSLESQLRSLASSLGYSLVKRGSAQAASSKGKRRSAAVKYRDENGNSWTGRGMTPKWLVAAEKAGKSRESFRV